MTKISQWSSSAPSAEISLTSRLYFRLPGKAEEELGIFDALYYMYRLAGNQQDFAALDKEGTELASFKRGRFNATPEIHDALTALVVMLNAERDRLVALIEQDFAAKNS